MVLCMCAVKDLLLSFSVYSFSVLAFNLIILYNVRSLFCEVVANLCCCECDVIIIILDLLNILLPPRLTPRPNLNIQCCL